MRDAADASTAPRATDGAALPAWVLTAREDPALAFVERAWTRAAATPGAWYDEALAEAIVALWPRYFRHTEGRWAGKPFHLRPWQAAIVRLLVGWRNADGFRLFRRLMLWIGRKNGKTEFIAALSLLFFVFDGEMGGQAFAMASNEKQARIVFEKAKTMVALSPKFKGRVQAFKKSLFVPELWARFEVLSGKAEGKHGLSASVIAGDEMHEWPTEDLYNALHQSIGARDQPIELLGSTAGYKGRGYGWQLWEECQAIASGAIEDATTLVVIFAADPDDDWTEETVWRKANPNLGISPKLDYLRAEFAKARNNPRRENAFRRYHLNQWVENAVRWFPLEVWDRCTAAPGSWKTLAERLAGRPCFGGLDLSSTRDITALVWVFPPLEDGERWTILPRFFAPADTIEERSRQDRVPYDLWRAEGALIATEGNVVDQDAVKAQLLADSALFAVEGVGYDPWNATKLATELLDEGTPLVVVRQGIPTLGEPSKLLERLVFQGLVEHGGHPVLRWMAGNVAVKQDNNANFKPDKAKSSEKIDGISGAVNALAVHVHREEDETVTGADILEQIS